MISAEGAWSIASKAWSFLRWWQTAPPGLRAWVFAHVLVPALAGSTVFLYPAGEGPLPSEHGRVAIAPLRSAVRAGGAVEARTGVAVIIDHAAREFSISMSADNPELWTSLELDALRNNRQHVTVHPDSFSISSLSVPGAPPLVVVAPGLPGDQAYVNQTVVPLSGVTIAPRAAASLPLAVMLCAAFGVGLVAAAEHGGADKHAQEDEDGVVQGNTV